VRIVEALKVNTSLLMLELGSEEESYEKLTFTCTFAWVCVDISTGNTIDDSVALIIAEALQVNSSLLSLGLHRIRVVFV